MKRETTKSFILIVLIGISLLLTFSLWNYKPTSERLNSAPLVNEVDMGGKEETKKGIIEPSSIIFHTNDHYFGFSDPAEMRNLFQNMQMWSMYDFRTKEANGRKPENYEVEVIFPTAIPMEVVGSIFNFNDEIALPSWNFKRMYFTFESKKASLEVQFLSENGQEQASAIINDSSNYEELWDKMLSLHGLDEYIVFNEGQSPIYLPAKKTKLEKRRLTTENIKANELVNALFKDPSIVRANLGETYFTDGYRQMNVDQDGKVMEYFFPDRTESEQMNPLSLLDNSITNINDHKGWPRAYNASGNRKGWTVEYNLAEMETTINENRVRYQMYYEGYPVYNSDGLSIIEQEWRGQVLTKYQRPLFSLSNPLDDESIDLPSGNDIVYYLKNKLSSNYKLKNIQDIQLGYRLHYINNDSLVTLEPTWYMNYSGNWIEIKQKLKEGLEDAMESD